METIENAYVFQRGFAARARLNYQYYLWQDVLRFHIHPSILPLPEYATVADVATGSGIWLLDLAKKSPSGMQFDGFDISLDQCPPAKWLPGNVKFHQWNFFDPVPEHMVEMYDVIHLRLIAVVIKDNDPTVIIQKLIKMLKPGGYLQWEEHSADIEKNIKTSENLEAPGLEQVRQMLTQPTKGDDGQNIIGPRTWLQTLPQTLKKEGFQEAKTDVYKEENYMTSFWTDLWLVGTEEMADNLLKGRNPEKDKKVREILSKSAKEVLSGVAVPFEKCVTVARKGR